MKTSKMKRMLALVLVLCMSFSMAVPAYAGKGKGKGKGPRNDNSSTSSESTMTLVEDDSTVEEGTELRASTYELNNSVSTQADSTTTLKYFPVTMYDYDATTINNATHQVEVGTGLGDTWNGIYFNDGSPKAEPYKNSNQLAYAAWNWWNKKMGHNNYGQYTYSGLVESSLTANKDIIFTKPESGIFNSDTSVKNIYTNVDMPFVYKDGTYTFDASKNGVYFYADSTQGSTAAQSNGRLYFNEGKPQTNNHSGYGDGSTTVWMPFNSTQSIDGESNCDYHFGMRTTIPFTMTANGKINPNDDSSKDITFSFSGDDDVWVFIDGQLVIDLGGIHNRLDATINFAKNTWTLSKSNSVNVAVADYNGAAISGTLFNEGDTTGTLNQTRETFAATDSHELTIFYLERGAGSSNCKIEFNLPMKDTVSVTKRVAGTASVGSNNTVTTEDNLNGLTDEQKAVLKNLDFGFTLYKDRSAVANANYVLLNENGQIIDNRSTNANGHFTLKDGQTAKFVGAFTTSGNAYYVVEDIKDGFIYTDYDVSGQVANSGITDQNNTYTYFKEKDAYYITDKDYQNGRLESSVYEVKGSDEAEESLKFECKNYMNASLPRPSAIPSDDTVVIDYGLPVVIDLSGNDYYLGDSAEISFGNANANGVYTTDYGTFTYNNGSIKYQLNKQLTGVEVITYTLTSKATANDGTEVTAKATANVYIIPATSMYYEEDFDGLVTFPNGWSDVGTAQTDPQEPGVVGTVGDSPYGSDAAYLKDSGDSNGSSKYVNTKDNAATFSYTFTGTGTTFYARTTNNSGYMRVVIKDAEEKTVYTGYRDTSYKNSEGSIGGDINVTGGKLYNIPVFTYNADGYGTYTVTVTVAGGANAKNYGKEFWLDGIRVLNPLNTKDSSVSIAESAYATDGEANMTVATLREKLIGEAQINEDDTISWNEGDNFVIFTDTNNKITAAEEYRSNGPKEEVYLDNTQSVTFSLTGWDSNSNKIYLGIKAPAGKGTVSINGNRLEINNAADCYYDISSYANITTSKDSNKKEIKIAAFTVTCTSELISLTNIKVTGNAKFVIVNQKDENL